MLNFILFLVITIYIYSITKSYYLSHGNMQKVFVVLLFIVHFAAMGLAYNNTIVDAIVFYENAENATSWFSLLGLGSLFMSFLIYPLVHLGVSMFVLFLLFATISYRVFLWYFNQMSSHYGKGLMIYGVPLTQLFFLLPSLHYWSGFLGKDALVFFFLTYLLFEVKKKARLNLLHGIVLTLLFLLRPHVFVAVFVAVFIYYFFQKRNSNLFKIKLSILTVMVVGLSVPIMMHFVKMKELTYSGIVEKIHEINNYAIQSGSGINLMETSYLGRIWLLLFRPLFYDATTFYQYIVSVENGFVLFFFIRGSIYLYSRRKGIVVNQDVTLALLIGISIFLMIATYIYNLGLASRMRLMFLPLFFYALHQLVYCQYDKKT